MSQSNEPSPEPSMDARSPRVCIPCRRKKKRCDKALPACGRCLKTLDICQHEGDPGVVVVEDGTIDSVAVNFLARYPSHGGPWMGRNGSDSGTSAGGFTDNTAPALFETSEDVNLSALHCLLRLVGNRTGVESIMSEYFVSLNSWFIIVDQPYFTEQVEDMWLSPSADVALLLLCMALITRWPPASGSEGHVPTPPDGLYLSAKMLFTLVEAKMPRSLPLYQSALLIAMYEIAHAMDEKAFLTVNSCIAMSRSFRWQEEVFWAKDRWPSLAAELKAASILWWATVFVDCLLHAAYPEQDYPCGTGKLSVLVPLPETFDPYLAPNGMPNLVRGDQCHPNSSADREASRIQNVLWPEARTIMQLSRAIQLTHRYYPSVAERDALGDEIMAYALEIMSKPEKYGHRCVVLAVGLMATFMLYEHSLRNPSLSLLTTEPDKRPVDTLVFGINSVLSMSEAVKVEDPQHARSPSPPGCVCIYAAARLLVCYGNRLMPVEDYWPTVSSFRDTLKLQARRWRYAETHSNILSFAIDSRLQAVP